MIISAIRVSLALFFLTQGLYGAFFKPLLLSEFNPEIIESKQWLVSQKLDGVRGIWDGEQMYFRSGKVMPLPKDWIAHFPPFALDGEIYSPHLHFSHIISILKNTQKNDFKALQYFVFDVPFAEGNGLLERLKTLETYLDSKPRTSIVILPQEPMKDIQSLYAHLQNVIESGGEGLVLREAEADYESGRSKRALKLKVAQDAECEVKAHTQGKGKYTGQLGALVCEFNGKSFKIGSGFNDAQRANPPPIGSIVTFKYYGLTHNGIPRFPIFWRVKIIE
ncbi:DNA ligase [Helicobacter jaachi]|uniref:DNA ligase n=1 Tax=Helicobacter jaachi TaxID=1677920 RepID=A0A4U8TCZ2_9HELI|nr:DNA ligase [Helicobacter jaachi]TLD97850.1 DNA ligase [Helicobacter jaachi]